MASSTSIRFPDGLKAEASTYADSLGISLNALCAVALRDYLDARRAVAASTVGRGCGEAVPVTPDKPAGTYPKPKGGVNQPCPCGSGKKYKQCHGKPGNA